MRIARPPTPAIDWTGRRIEIPFLDGVRGLAALYVVLYHAYLFTGPTNAFLHIPYVGRIVGYGYLGVPVFIVLSGYLLMIPVARREGYLIGGSAIAFLKKRSRRILPPYYAALALSLLLIVAVPIMRVPNGTQWDTKVPVTIPDVLSHVFMLHDLSPAWIEKIDGPLWSVAVEWQIYFFMPLVLLPLWRRIGGYATTALALGVVTALAALGLGSFAHPWFVALFAIGMLAGELTVSKRLPSWPLAILTALFAITIVITYRVTTDGVLAAFAPEVAVGLLVATVLTWGGTIFVQTGQPPLLLRFLSLKPFALLGLFSYSLYLLHSPFLALFNLLTLPLGLPVTAQYLLMTLVAVPIAIGICWLFFLLVEKRFLNTRQRTVEKFLNVDLQAEKSIRGSVTRPRDGAPRRAGR